MTTSNIALANGWNGLLLHEDVCRSIVWNTRQLSGQGGTVILKIIQHIADINSSKGTLYTHTHYYNERPSEQ